MSKKTHPPRTGLDARLSFGDRLVLHARLEREKRRLDAEVAGLREWARKHGMNPKRPTPWWKAKPSALEVADLRAWLAESKRRAEEAPKRRERTTPKPKLDDLVAVAQWLLANWPTRG